MVKPFFLSTVKSLLRIFFRLLYHQFAFTYDLVAAAVSLNHWKDWVKSVVPFIEGRRVLEIGHGPGHLQRILRSRQWVAVGIDESTQMGRLAKRNLKGERSIRSPLTSTLPSQDLPSSYFDYTQINLVRGVAQDLPFPNSTFDTIIATFPTEYINNADTLEEMKRCLAETGRLVVLPVAMPKNRFLDWLFAVTNQRPTEALEMIQTRLQAPFVAAGFQTEIKTLDMKSGVLLIVLATKSSI